MPYWWLLLLPVAAFSGWLTAKRSDQKHYGAGKRLPRDYFLGLNYLLNEQPDKAVDIFIKMLEVDSDTVETHLALGNLFRRRGEVDRAIRIHQNLIARPNLAKEERIQAMLELGQDYMCAGVFDRAESLFLEVVDMGQASVVSMRHLLAIYQQEKDWPQAIRIAQQLENTTHESMHNIISHFYCEQAANAITTGQCDQAQLYLRRAAAVDPNCVRVSILSGELAYQTGRYKQAVRSYRRVREQDPDFLPEIIKPLADCYEKLNSMPELVQFIEDCLQEHSRTSLVLWLSDYLQRTEGDEVSLKFLTQQLHSHPSVRGLHRLIMLQLRRALGGARDNLALLRDLTESLLQNKPVYRCEHCGFAGKSLYWYCPSCKSWDTVKPIYGVEGE